MLARLSVLAALLLLASCAAVPGYTPPPLDDKKPKSSFGQALESGDVGADGRYEMKGAEKQMDRRTGCLQANVEFLQQELVKLRRETQAQVAAAKAEARAETKAQSDALKAALTKLEAELAQVKAKTEPKVEKKQ